MVDDGDGDDGVESAVAEGQRQSVGAESVETPRGGDGGQIEGTIATDFEEGVRWLD